MSEEQPNKLKPVIIIPPKMISKADLKSLRDNNFVVVECADPAAVRFCEPPPTGYSAQEKAAIDLCRYLITQKRSNYSYSEISQMMVHFFTDGTPLNPIEPIKKK